MGNFKFWLFYVLSFFALLLCVEQIIKGNDLFIYWPVFIFTLFVTCIFLIHDIRKNARAKRLFIKLKPVLFWVAYLITMANLSYAVVMIISGQKIIENLLYALASLFIFIFGFRHLYKSAQNNKGGQHNG